jgi:hypothetical protein
MIFTVLDSECGPGWLSLVAAILTRANTLGIRVRSVTEKYGKLRIDWEPPFIGSELDPGEQNLFSSFVDAAELLSGLICEKCGKPGSLRDVGWLKTWCNQHYVEYGDTVKASTHGHVNI